ncbi:hypothetical protein SAMN04487764_1830 [Gillisia sp. Hel1_33_143]|uniref:DUF6624 domain-containing protein n=1 Tax=unclassified Gillisia TaxID=2615025 RepID=UPI00068E02F6|nr:MULTISPECIES: DUF6624 domain-containing protein [unclassified Gillisia]SDS26963.1 hypothetical protein SAMN04487764_1830 [Gillisia sp. Hel1_33_143]
MKHFFRISLFVFLFVGCKEQKIASNQGVERTELNNDLIQELNRVIEIDQLAASNAFPPENYSDYSQEKWNLFKDSIYKSHQRLIVEIIEKNGYPGYSLVGNQGSNIAFIIVQHSDHDPEFQKEYLEQMKIEVEKGNDTASNYALLTDRSNLNTGKKQIYGTQVAYNFKISQAYPKNLKDSLNVNERRKAIGLEPLEDYLNRMSEMNFEMNKKIYLKNGITKPTLYKTD